MRPPPSLSTPMPFRLGPIPLRVTEGEFNAVLGIAFLPMLLDVIAGLFLGDAPIFIPYTIGAALVLGLSGSVFFGVIKKGRPDSYLYDWAQSTHVLAWVAHPQRGMIVGGQRLIARAQPGVIRHKWGGAIDEGPQDAEGLVFPDDGRGGTLPRFIRHPALPVSLASLQAESP